MLNAQGSLSFDTERNRACSRSLEQTRHKSNDQDGRANRETTLRSEWSETSALNGHGLIDATVRETVDGRAVPFAFGEGCRAEASLTGQTGVFL